MPTTKSAMKRQRQTVTSTLINKSKKSRITSVKREFDLAVNHGNEEDANTAMRELCSVLDKAVKTGVIKSNKADRGKSRAIKALSKLKV